MKILDALVKSSPSTDEQRYSFSEWISEYFTFGGSKYPLGVQTTYGSERAEPIGADFTGHVRNAYQANGVISAVEMVRFNIFSEARFRYQAIDGGTGSPSDAGLIRLERPWPGGTTGDLLARMILDADLAGNAYITEIDGELVRLRPDWVEIVLEERKAFVGPNGEAVAVGLRRIGYFYYEGGRVATKTPAFFLAHEVAHFAPMPDPLATYRGMSWLTPIVREIQADTQATKHKLKFFENAATPNLAVKLPKELTPAQFTEFVDMMDAKHKGVQNAYKTLYTGGGADVTVIGADMKQLDFKLTQGAGETRIAAAGGIHPVIVGLSEGMQGSSLNAGNFSAARRRVGDGTMRPLWRNVCGSLEVLVTPPPGERLWYDDRGIGFLREDAKDVAEILSRQMLTIESGVRAGFKPDAVVLAVAGEDVSLLTGEHTGLFSVQLQPPAEEDDSNAAPAAEGL